MNMEQELLYWVGERERVRKRKEDGEPWPWSTDPIFQSFRFCNVRRRDDKVSKWLRENIYSKGWEKLGSGDHFLMFSALCRYVNWPPTIQDMLDNGVFKPDMYSLADALEVMDDRKRRKEKVYGNAYIIKGSNVKGASKSEFIVNKTCGMSLHRKLPIVKRALETKSKEQVAKALITVKGWGTFMSGQVVDDWTWCSLLEGAIDQFAWAPVGPGSSRGYNRMLGRQLTAGINANEWSSNLQKWRQHIILELGDEFSDITLHDMQSILCELDKFRRVKEGGEMKVRYVPKGPNQW